MWEKGTMMSDIRAILGHWGGRRSGLGSLGTPASPTLHPGDGVWLPGAAPDPRDHGPGGREHPRGTGTPRSRHHNPLITGRKLGPKRGEDLPRFTGHTGRAGPDLPLPNPFIQSSGSKGALDTGWGVPAVGGMAAPEDMSHPNPGACDGDLVWEKGLCRCDQVSGLRVGSPSIRWLGPNAQDKGAAGTGPGDEGRG